MALGARVQQLTHRADSSAAAPPPVANPPTLACVEGISRATVNAAGVALDFDTPPVTAGQGTVNVTCSPGSG